MFSLKPPVFAGLAASGHVMDGSFGAAASGSFIILEVYFRRPPLLVQPVSRAAVRITPAKAKRRCAALGKSLQFADLLLVFSRGKHGAPHSPNFAGGKSWQVPSNALSLAKLGSALLPTSPACHLRSAGAPAW